MAAAACGQRVLSFDDTTVDYRGDLDRATAGFAAADAFRRGLLAADPRVVGRLLERFRGEVTTPPDRPGLSRFRVTAESFAIQLAGDALIDAPFDAFGGRWHGLWDGLEVNHHWRPVAPLAALRPAVRRLGFEGRIDAQFAWVGDGFGWNYLAQPAGRAGSVVLGYVYHVAHDDPSRVRSEFPLVGYADGPGRLVWVTPSALFFEEVNSSGATQRYTITGCEHRTVAGVAEPVGRPFQAVYTRDPADRPAWLRLEGLTGPDESTPSSLRHSAPASKASTASATHASAS